MFLPAEINGRRFPVHPENIIALSSAGNYVDVFTLSGRKVPARGTIKEAHAWLMDKEVDVLQCAPGLLVVIKHIEEITEAGMVLFDEEIRMKFSADDRKELDDFKFTATGNEDYDAKAADIDPEKKKNPRPEE